MIHLYDPTIPGGAFPESVVDAALRYVAAGLSVLPIAPGGKKSPVSYLLPRRASGEATWKTYQFRLPYHHEIFAWRGHNIGLAIITGSVSGGLEAIDFDAIDLFEPWAAKVEAARPGLLARLPQVRSPRPGVHVYFRSRAYREGDKLAWALGSDGTWKILIETRSEGNCCVAPPTPGICHESGRPYLWAPDSVDVTRVPTITPADRDVLLGAARKFNQKPPPQPRAARSSIVPARGIGMSCRPGDEYERRATWEEILHPFGWEDINYYGSTIYWRRPGKDVGHSATTGYCTGDDDADLLYVFSSNADPFEADTAYGKFHAYALLYHDGDFSKAAAALRRLGFGAPGNITFPIRTDGPLTP
jgi:putative DNA primase/helicase